MPLTWKEAYLKQAKSDYSIFKKLNELQVDFCQELHYLQMASEKLAKSLTCPFDNTPPKKTHYALVGFIRTIKVIDFSKKFGQKNFVSYKNYIDSILPFADKIEKLHPSGEISRPNPEYPWEDNYGNVQSPIDYGFDDIKNDRIGMSKFKTFISKLIEIADQI